MQQFIARVYRNDRHDFYALTRYHDVEEAHRDSAVFSFMHIMVFELMGH